MIHHRLLRQLVLGRRLWNLQATFLSILMITRLALRTSSTFAPNQFVVLIQGFLFLAFSANLRFQIFFLLRFFYTFLGV